MNQKLAFVLAFSIALSFGFSAYSDFQLSPISGKNPDINGARVVDCRNSTTTCSTSVIQKRVSTCYEHWTGTYDTFNCSFTTENLDSVQLITDPSNYVTGKTYGDRDAKFYSRTDDMPWDLEFLPSGTPIWTTRPGNIYWKPRNMKEKITELPVLMSTETGLLGMAVDPSFEENKFIYLYITSEKTNRTNLKGNPIIENHIARYKMVNRTLVLNKTLLTVPGAKWHSGGRLEIGPDNKLYVSTGDAGMTYFAGDKEFLGGKILRVNLNGSVPKDNPFNNYVYSRGHRNPQGLAWAPETGDLYITEHGHWKMDEINRIEPGESYGWPRYECNKTKKDIWIPKNYSQPYEHNNPPEFCWQNFTMAPSGITFVHDRKSPWYGDLFVAGLRGSHLSKFELEDGELTNRTIFYIPKDISKMGIELRDVEYHNNSLFIVSSNRGITRITPGKEMIN